MSQYKDAAIESTVYFWFAANETTGTAGDGASPLFDVRLAGAAANAAPVLSGTPTLLTHANYTDGLHEIAVAATDANGFAAGNEYAVFCTLTISTVNPAGFCGSFKLVAAGKNLHAITDAILTDTAEIGTAGAGLTNIGTIATCTNLTNAPTNGDLTATMKSSITAAVPTAAACGTDAASKVLVTPAQKIVTDANGYVTYANTAPPTAADIKTAVEAAGSHLALIKAVTDKVDTLIEVIP